MPAKSLIPIRMQTGIMIDATRCNDCEVLKARACNAIFPGGAWPAVGRKPCPAVLAVPECTREELP